VAGLGASIVPIDTFNASAASALVAISIALKP
jgi:hypothetical protein